MGKTHQPIATREIGGGIQNIYRFPNNYGASVVSHSFSYGHEQGLWELAVIYWPDPENPAIFAFDLTYDTPITGNVIGYLNDEEVNELLDQINALPT